MKITPETWVNRRNPRQKLVLIERLGQNVLVRQGSYKYRKISSAVFFENYINEEVYLKAKEHYEKARKEANEEANKANLKGLAAFLIKSAESGTLRVDSGDFSKGKTGTSNINITWKIDNGDLCEAYQRFNIAK